MADKNIRKQGAGSLIAGFLLGGLALAWNNVFDASSWEISDTLTLKDTTIVMNGNLTVRPGGSLTLEHVTLKMNVGEDGEYRGIYILHNSSAKIQNCNLYNAMRKGTPKS